MATLFVMDDIGGTHNFLGNVSTIKEPTKEQIGIYKIDTAEYRTLGSGYFYFAVLSTTLPDITYCKTWRVNVKLTVII